MYQDNPAVLDDKHARLALDVHFSMALRCTVADLHRPGWTIVTASDEDDPMALLFGQRTLLSLFAPASQTADQHHLERTVRSERAGVALVTAELRAPVAALLKAFSPSALFTIAGLQCLQQLVSSLSPGTALSDDVAHMRACYVTPATYTPYMGQWQEWIEPLDEFREVEPLALSLLARYNGGVYVVRDTGMIATYAGIRAHSPHTAEINVYTDVEALRGHALGRAVVSRATKAIFATGRVPLYRHATTNTAAAHIASALGYRPYADTITYIAPV